MIVNAKSSHPRSPRCTALVWAGPRNAPSMRKIGFHERSDSSMLICAEFIGLYGFGNRFIINDLLGRDSAFRDSPIKKVGARRPGQ